YINRIPLPEIMAEKQKQTAKATEKTQGSISIEDMAVFCKRKGFVYPSSEIYGGMAGFWDFGPLGAELFNNIKSSFWKFFVQSREDMVGMEASIISHPRTWKASGHIENFGDLVITCSKCKQKLRADHFIEEKLGINAEGKKVEEINKIIKDNKLKCQKCGSNFEELKKFNLLFETKVGAEEDKSSIAYLRGETAQGMFLDFKLITDTTRVKLPFGIVQIGRCFRNEIAPRDFLFRLREFHIGEFEFFIHPKMQNCDILADEQLKLKIPLLSAEMQDKGKNDLVMTSIKDMIKSKKLDEWHGYWLAEQVRWFLSIGIKMEHLKIREHTKPELSHYSSATFDVDYLYPFGSKEIAGNANRGQYDLNQHIKESGKDLSIFDEETKEKIVPRVIEPTFGMERVFLGVLCEAYEYDNKRENVVLHLHPKLAPIKIAVLPLVNKLEDKAREIFNMLKDEFPCVYDKSGSVGRRYARMDEIGTPYCVTVDFETIEKDDSVTIRDRDTTKQVRVKISELKGVLSRLISGEMSFSKL
ncbi:MAG: glycine--tRNA ligase, partial [Nanoarchaeota archaeon]|nr:glycine--tRNA ligase [Nanoarchaeota archaeon]